jgi:hypothetical protein
LMLPWITGILVLILVTLAACVEVEVVDTTPAAGTLNPFISPPPVSHEKHNLAILAVDFDPPLTYQQLIVRRQSVALLVAIENTGTAAEQDVMVRAQLSTPENSDFLLTQGASLTSIAPGEIQIVRFARLGEIPYHQTYYLEVIADPVDGEIDFSDNRKAFDIQIHQK